MGGATSTAADVEVVTLPSSREQRSLKDFVRRTGAHVAAIGSSLLLAAKGAVKADECNGRTANGVAMRSTRPVHALIKRRNACALHEPKQNQTLHSLSHQSESQPETSRREPTAMSDMVTRPLIPATHCEDSLRIPTLKVKISLLFLSFPSTIAISLASVQELVSQLRQKNFKVVAIW